MKSSWRGFGAGWLIILVGSFAAYLTHTAGGEITIKDVRFNSSGGKTLSALLYIPPSATSATKAPGILAVHGYINSREVQSGFAIEFARRGYVVLALDQTGHGYSQGAAFSEGFGGPAALAYLRSLDMVDIDNIGLEGHSMGGWTVLAAAAAMPNDYQAMVLEGSSTGAPFAAEGTPDWPRNVAVVFSEYDEFAQAMWGVAKARDVSGSAKLQALFGADASILTGKVYGDMASGTARILQQPPVTHAGDHISHVAIGHALDWFAQSLEGGRSLSSNDQIWFRKEIGTLVALVGFVVLVLGSFQLLLQTSYFRQLQGQSLPAANDARTLKWWAAAILLMIFPVATFYLFFGWAEAIFPPSAWIPQGITNQVVFWAIANGVIASIVGFVLLGKSDNSAPKWVASVLIALATVAIAYIAVWLVEYFFLVDFRFWFVGVKAMNLSQFKIALIYLLPFTAYFILALRGLHSSLSVVGNSHLMVYITSAAILMGGFLIFLLAQYITLFTTGLLLTPGEPLNTIVMTQFVPLLLIVSIISTFTYLRTANYLPGALINALFVTWYVVAGQATHIVGS